MNKERNSFSDLLINKGLKPSHQRIKILDYLANHPCHPTADMILSEMKKELPTLSKSTVYKTLKAFVEAQLLRDITIENNEIRYEYNLVDHGHFKCERCGTIYDFNIDFGDFKYDELGGFAINDRNIYFKGLCKNCLTNNSQQ